MSKAIKNTFLVLVVFITLFGVFSPAFAEEEPKGPALELVYPIIPGETEKVPINSGLPAYINYIYRLAMALIGVIVFGVLIYNGVLWFTSAGNADKLKTAKDGITASFLGAIILFSAFIIFRTINPQLTRLELKDPDAVEPIIIPGIYICNYNVAEYAEKVLGINFGSITGDYLENKGEKRLEATKNFKKIIKNEKGGCYLGLDSSPLQLGATKSSFSLNGKNTIFVIPEEKYIMNTETGETTSIPVYNYGAILHENDKFGGNCYLIEPTSNNEDKTKVYGKFTSLSLLPKTVGFSTAMSVTIFKKTEYVSGGASLHECVDWNETTSLCPPGVTGTPKDIGIPGSTEIKKIDDLVMLEGNTRSIKLYPEENYFAVLFSQNNFNKGTTDENGKEIKEENKKICQVITKSDNSLIDDPIGRCGEQCIYTDPRIQGGPISGGVAIQEKCKPCAKSMYIITGKVIGY